MAERVFAYVGTPDSGITNLEDALWRRQPQLRAQGLLLPGPRALHRAGVHAVVGKVPPALPATVDPSTAWPRMLAASREWPGSVLLAGEALGVAGRGQAASVATAFGKTPLSVVISTRSVPDLAVRAWQRVLKAGGAPTYDGYLRGLRANLTPRSLAFWAAHDPLDVASRWGERVRPDDVHVVLNPTGNDDRDTAWPRLSSVLGVDVPLPVLDPSPWGLLLGPVEAELLRRVHTAGDYRFRDGDRHRWTRRLLAVGLLASRPAGAIALPPEHREWLGRRSDALLRGIRAGGYRLVGDPADLLLPPDPPSARLVADVTDDEIAELSRWTIDQLQETWVHLETHRAPPEVADTEGVDGILDMLEHIRAAESDLLPRPASHRGESLRLRALLQVLRARASGAGPG